MKSWDDERHQDHKWIETLKEQKALEKERELIAQSTTVHTNKKSAELAKNAIHK